MQHFGNIAKRKASMHSSYVPLLDAIDSLDAALDKVSSEKRPLIDIGGWSFPTADRTDLRYMLSEIRDIVVERAPDEEEDQTNVNELVRRFKMIESQIVPMLYNGNGQVAAPNYYVSVKALQAWIEAIWPERTTVALDSLPSKLAKQARTQRLRLDNAQADVEEVEQKLRLISDAHAAAEALPTDLEELKQLRAAMLTASNQTATDREAVGTARAQADDVLKQMISSQELAQKLVAQCEEAYQITTTKGLSAAFAQRATRLSVSMWVWVCGLLIALGAVAFLGHDRITALSALLVDDPKWGVVVLNLLLSALSVGAPLWFAWVATKQIGQRFRLAEDYGFKASVAKAYEGYRREAARIDPKFEAQLFSIALTRLEEAPLRMVEAETHGSPYHELFSGAKHDPALAQTLSDLVKKFRSAKSHAPVTEEPAAS
jgi:CheY-like chemotaxis protein